LRKIQIKMVGRSYSRLAVMVVTTKRGAARDGDSGNRIVVWALIAGRWWKLRHAQTWKHSPRLAAEREWIMKTISKEQWSATDIDLARGADEEMKQVSPIVASPLSQKTVKLRLIKQVASLFLFSPHCTLLNRSRSTNCSSSS
jgi:hypothetical protein